MLIQVLGDVDFNMARVSPAVALHQFDELFNLEDILAGLSLDAQQTLRVSAVWVLDHHLVLLLVIYRLALFCAWSLYSAIAEQSFGFEFDEL